VDVALTATMGAQEVRWTERRWLVRSQAYAQAQEAALERRLAKAEAALRDLPARKRGKKQLFHAELVRTAEAALWSSPHGFVKLSPDTELPILRGGGSDDPQRCL
jgi:hypothetical protein